MTDLEYKFKNGKTLTIGKKTLIMGILNITPDSFSDGGKWQNIDDAVAHAREMVRLGADIIDIGAESTRPGADPISADEEKARLLPVLSRIAMEIPIAISADTCKAAVAAAALEAGADIINDVWGLQNEAEPEAMATVAGKYKAPVIIMHHQPVYDYEDDFIDKIRRFLRRSISIALRHGVPRENIILDPGIGFGKNTAVNLAVLRYLSELKDIDGTMYPYLLGVSRKSFLGETLDLPVTERIEATAAACVWGILNGANILRVHDVKEISRTARMIDAIKEA